MLPLRNKSVRFRSGPTWSCSKQVSFGVGNEAVPTFVEPPSLVVYARLAPSNRAATEMCGLLDGAPCRPWYSVVSNETLQHGSDNELRDNS